MLEPLDKLLRDLGISAPDAPRRTQEGDKPVRDGQGIAKLAFPDDQHTPVECCQPIQGTGIPRDVGIELRMPVFLPCPGHRGSTACWIRVLVPKAAMHHHDLAAAREGEVWPSRQVAAMQAETVAECVGDAPDQDLRPRVLAADRRHGAAARLRNASKGGS